MGSAAYVVRCVVRWVQGLHVDCMELLQQAFPQEIHQSLCQPLHVECVELLQQAFQQEINLSLCKPPVSNLGLPCSHHYHVHPHHHPRLLPQL